MDGEERIWDGRVVQFHQFRTGCWASGLDEYQLYDVSRSRLLKMLRYLAGEEKGGKVWGAFAH